jgi:cyd operon protein YbgT
MWYFSWMLGIGLACCFAILNAMWIEARNHSSVRDDEFEAHRAAPFLEPSTPAD